MRPRLRCRRNLQRLGSTMFPFSEAGPSYHDDGSQVILSIPVKREDGASDIEVAFIGTDQIVQLIRIGFPNSDGNLTASEQDWAGRLVEHAIAVLRIAYDDGLERVRVGH